MIKVQRFPFNAFEVNTYVLYDESRKCIVIDAGMQDQSENDEIVAYIEGNGLKPVMLLNTHTHIRTLIIFWEMLFWRKSIGCRLLPIAMLKR